MTEDQIRKQIVITFIEGVRIGGRKFHIKVCRQKMECWYLLKGSQENLEYGESVENCWTPLAIIQQSDGGLTHFNFNSLTLSWLVWGIIHMASQTYLAVIQLGDRTDITGYMPFVILKTKQLGTS